jgi:hypothetical protein
MVLDSYKGYTSFRLSPIGGESLVAAPDFVFNCDFLGGLRIAEGNTGIRFILDTVGVYSYTGSLSENSGWEDGTWGSGISVFRRTNDPDTPYGNNDGIVVVGVNSAIGSHTISVQLQSVDSWDDIVEENWVTVISHVFAVVEAPSPGHPKAYNVYPEDEAENVEITDVFLLIWGLRYYGSDFNQVRFNVYFGSEFGGMSLVSSLNDSNSFRLPQSQTYSIFDNLWRVDTVYPDGTTTPGDTWSFCISTSFVITPAINPTPANTATGVSRTVEFTWEGGDVIGWPVPVSYKIYIDDELARTSETKSFSPPALGYNQIVSWRVDTYAGASWATSSTWTFTTATLGGYPLPTGENTISQKRRLIAAAADRIWIEDI